MTYMLKKMAPSELKEFLDEKVELYNNPNFIESDPIQIPHSYSLKEDIEIAGFLTATIAWGNRKMIITNAKKMVDLMGNSPYDFVMNHSNSQLKSLENFVHRTFNGQDFATFVNGLQHIYQNHNGLEAVFPNKIRQCNTPFQILKNCFLKFRMKIERKNIFQIQYMVRLPSVLICIYVGWYEKILKVSIWEFGKTLLPLNCRALWMYIRAM